MPWLTNIIEPVRASGVPFVEVDGWQNRGHGSMSGVKTIACHHTAGPPEGDHPSLNTCIYGRPGLEGPLCQLFLSRTTGTIHVVAAGLAYHAGEVKQSSYSNAWAIGIEAEATGVSPWHDPQYSHYAMLCEALCDFYGITSDDIVLGHKEICSPSGRKIDPNFDMHAFRALCDDIEGGGMSQQDINELKNGVLMLVQMMNGPNCTLDQPWPAGAGWPARRYDPPDGVQINASMLDYLREIDRQVNSNMDLTGRPGQEFDNEFGQVLSTRQLVADLICKVDELAAKVDDLTENSR